jgi:uncharacterized protein YacL
MRSKIFKLNKKDFIKGLIVALVGSIPPASIIPFISFKSIIIIFVSVLITYLTKNLLTNNNDEILKSDK